MERFSVCLKLQQYSFKHSFKQNLTTTFLFFYTCMNLKPEGPDGKEIFVIYPSYYFLPFPCTEQRLQMSPMPSTRTTRFDFNLNILFKNVHSFSLIKREL